MLARVAGPARRHDAAAAGGVRRSVRCCSRASRRSGSRAWSGSRSAWLSRCSTTARRRGGTDRQGAAVPAHRRATEVVIIVVALYVRGWACRRAGARRAAAAGGAAARAARGGRRRSRSAGGDRAGRAPVRLSQRAGHLDGGDDDLPVLRRDHRLRRPGLAHAGGARRRPGFVVSHLPRTPASASRCAPSPATSRDRDGSSPAPRRCACAASAWRS